MRVLTWSARPLAQHVARNRSRVAAKDDAEGNLRDGSGPGASNNRGL